jgi:alkylation response protein AidB-like acyl-CoA dehydrogenase
MDFELNEEQQAFADSVRRFAEAYLKEGARDRAHGSAVSPGGGADARQARPDGHLV